MNRKRIAVFVATLAGVAAFLLWLLGRETVTPRPSAQPAEQARSAPAPTVPPPAPRPPADLGPGDSFEVVSSDGTPLPVTLWPGRPARAPLVVFLAGGAEDAEGWTPLLRALRAARNVSLAVVWSPGRSKRVVPSIADPVARKHREAAHVAEVLAELMRRLPRSESGVALCGSSDSALAVLMTAAEDRGVRATAVLSPTFDVDDRDAGKALEDLQRRLLFVGYAADDVRAAPTSRALVERQKPLQLSRVPGSLHGLDLLRERRIRSDLAGWLFAALGPRP